MIEIDILGCHFHYAKCMWKRVQANKMKNIYPHCPELQILMRAALGLPFVHVDSIKDGMKVLKKMSKNVKDKRKSVKKFANQFVDYIEENWVKSKKYPPATWNYFLHPGITTNNYAEAYNSKIAKKHTKHPNAYLLSKTIKTELLQSTNDAIAAPMGKKVRKPKSAKYKELRKDKKNAMNELRDYRISLRDYMIRMGSATDKFDTHSKTVGLDSDEDIVDTGEFEEEDDLEPNESIVQPSEASLFPDQSLRGAELRLAREHVDYANAFGDASKERDPKNLPIPPKSIGKKLTGLRLEQGRAHAFIRLAQLGFRNSVPTPGNGNCYIEAILDQMRNDPIHESLADMSSFDFRRMIVNFLQEEVTNNRFDWHFDYETYFGTVQQWSARMSQDGQDVDQIFQQLTADFLNRQIISYTVIPNENDRDRIIINPREPTTDEPFHLMLFSEDNFISPHYQSILPLTSASVQSTTSTTTSSTTNTQSNVKEPNVHLPLRTSQVVYTDTDTVSVLVPY